ncbi:MAG: hypothetical protein LC808_19995, partial [Actinobacteria bacterium]|nr:hypothetical protein [Actinomycetota bacterium]
MSPTFPQAPPVLTVEALAGVVSAALHQQQQHGTNHNMPSPGGQASEMAGHELCCGKAGLGGCGIPSTSPKGYHTAARGQSQMTHPPVLVRAA